MKTYVIVISGVTASGKTTLINALSQHLPDCRIISFDDYSIDALPGAPAINTPVNQAVNQYDIHSLMADFQALNGLHQFILIDFPFGYRHQVLAPYIDWVVYLKTPLDICLGRQILRDYQSKDISEACDWIKTYLDFARPIFIDHENYVSATANQIIDGSLPLNIKVEAILQHLSLS